VIETFSVAGESTHQDAMRAVGGQKAAVACVYDGRNNEPRAFLVVTEELLKRWAEILEKSW